MNQVRQDVVLLLRMLTPDAYGVYQQSSRRSAIGSWAIRWHNRRILICQCDTVSLSAQLAFAKTDLAVMCFA